MLPACVRTISKNGRTATNAMGLISKNAYSKEAQFDVHPYKLHLLEQGPSTHVTLKKSEALEMYKQMLSIRRMQVSAGNLYKEGLIRGFCHLYIGEEAVAVGFKHALRPQDNVITSFRSHGWTVLMGVTNTAMLAELTGKETGNARGKGGSMHTYIKNFYGGNGIVGAQAPLGAGIAYAEKYRGSDGVCVTTYGDGAANQGQIFEIYNIAKLLNIPVIFLCENNGYGMGTSSVRAAACTDYYTRGHYIPGIWVDGMDVLAVKQAAKFAINYCAAGKGPLVMEAATYRYVGHSTKEPGTSYRTREEVQEVRQTRDAIVSLKEKILSRNLATNEELTEIDVQVRMEIEDATKHAREDPEIGMDEMAADIYANPIEENVRGCSIYQTYKHKRIGPAVNQ